MAIRIIEKSRSKKSEKLGATSKMNRDPAFLKGLITQGAATGGQFVRALAFESAWRTGDPDAVLAFFADDCSISSEPPFVPISSTAGSAAGRQFITDRLATDVEIDLTRRQLAGDQFHWSVRSKAAHRSEQLHGQAAAQFKDGRIASFQLRGIGADRAIDRRIVV